MFRSLTARIALSFVFLTLALNIALLGVLRYAISSSYQKGIDTFLLEFAEGDLPDPDTPSTIEDLKADMERDPIGKDFYLRVLGPDNEVLVAAGMPDHPGLAPVRALAANTRLGHQRIDTVGLANGTELRVVTRKFEKGFAFQAGALLLPDPALEGRVMRFGLLSVVLLSLVAASIGWWMARRAMKGVRDVTLTARDILKGDLAARVPARQSVVEVSELANAFNTMLDRIETLVKDVKGVSASMAHDLRGPLTRIRGYSELALRGEKSGEDYKETASLVVEETLALEGLIDTTLEIIALDARTHPTRLVPTDLSELMHDTLDIYGDLAEEKGIHLEFTKQGETMARVDPATMRRVLANLVDNAIKFTPRQGTVRLSVEGLRYQVVLVVSDTGPGVPLADRSRVFDRFYRGDTSRGTPGYGLGLSYVQAAIRAHGGRIEIDDEPNGGARFVLWLPDSPER
ncbi:Histidine kinase [Sulfidibacter corallicola]|uniref:histidine kinase n=1 Tax=Sulfidibacter corallicola TaxID=2818388 RepID=A0A8A4TRR6_SULCO|nr:ATP-binding protein [Sulfidibacter corallicola]QTD51718.1 HAMP domain-containing protein [Sulfidibacter corallicola]